MAKDIGHDIGRDIQNALQGFRVLDYSVRIMDPVYAKGGVFTHTVLLFELVKQLRQAPAVLGAEMGDYLKAKHSDLIADYVVAGGYLNVQVTPRRWAAFLQGTCTVTASDQEPLCVIEYSSPNTNKPLHLGHLRNIFIGDALANLQALVGKVQRLNLINDRGIHICKSLIAYQERGNEEEPTQDLKGDALVGKYYVLFEQIHVKEYQQRKAAGLSEEEAQRTLVLKRAQVLLQQWEAGDPAVRALWAKLNAWAMDGMEATYARLKVSFDQEYKESDHYQQGRTMVLEALKLGLCYQKADQSVWIDLEEEGLGQKLLLRADGTSVYITQDLGIAEQKHQNHAFALSYYVVGDEQNYHFKVLFAILRRFGKSYADQLEHIAYGMVDLPEGRMKSREGTVVEADGLLDDLERLVQEKTNALGKIGDMEPAERGRLYSVLALGAIKYHLLRIHPSKRMLFDYEAALNLQGDTGIFIQYTYARIAALLRRAYAEGSLREPTFSVEGRSVITPDALDGVDSALLMALAGYAGVLEEARHAHDPSLLAHYVYQLAKRYNSWYASHLVFTPSATALMEYRLLVSLRVARVIRQGMGVLGIEVPDRM